jgi:hypothetical protein
MLVCPLEGLVRRAEQDHKLLDKSALTNNGEPISPPRSEEKSVLMKSKAGHTLWHRLGMMKFRLDYQ